MKRRLLLSSCLSSSLVTGTRGFALVDPPSVISQQRNTGDYRDDTLMDVRPKTPPSTALYSMSPPQQQHEPSSTELDTSPSSLIKDCITLFVYTVSCIALAVAVCWYHDYEVSHTKPQGLLRDQALYGLAYQQEDINGITYPAYNTVLENHRNVRIQMWNQPVETGMSRETAIQSIIQALESIHMLKKMANNYEWDKMQSTIRQPLFTTGLEEACTVLRKTAASTEARDEIGFDWGRHVSMILVVVAVLRSVYSCPSCTPSNHFYFTLTIVALGDIVGHRRTLKNPWRSSTI